MRFNIERNNQIPRPGTLAGDLYYRRTFLSDSGETKQEYQNRGIKPEGIKPTGIKVSRLIITPVLRIDLA